MKTKIYFILHILFFLTACAEDEVQTVYLPQGQATISKVFSITDDPYILKYTASLTGADFATVSKTANQDITLSFSVDMSLIESYNKECGTNYLPMPENSYSIPQSAVIQKGKSSTDSLSISIFAKDKFESFVPYMLPIRISGVQGAEAYKYQQIIYVALSGVADAENIQIYDRSGWQIAGFSTEEPGERGGNGLAVCLLDDNPNTFWHSKWSGGEPEPPHEVTIDMGEAKVLHGIALMNRNFEGDWLLMVMDSPRISKYLLAPMVKRGKITEDLPICPILPDSRSINFSSIFTMKPAT